MALHDLVVIGLSHRTAPVEVRERLAVPEVDLARTLAELVALGQVGEATLLSTCNRVEIVAAARGSAAGAAAELRHFLGLRSGLAGGALDEHLYEHAGRDAIRHVFRVAAALDSLVVGEAQILGQLKSAYGAASRSGAAGPVLSRFLERAFVVAKRVRTETGVARGAANVASAAVELARRIFGSLDGRSVLVVGAGKMSGLAARRLITAGARHIVVTNRSPDRAATLAQEVGGTARPFAELETLLAGADVAIFSTGAAEPIVDRAMMKRVARSRRGRPIFLVDIAVPRDVAAAAAELDGVYLFDVDDLGRVVEENLAERRREAEAAERLVDDEVDGFSGWLKAQAIVPTIKDLRARFEEVARVEVERAVAALGPEAGPRQADEVRRLADAIVAKLLHAPTMALRQGGDVDGLALAEAARRLFALTPGAPVSAAPETAAPATAVKDRGGPA